MGHFGILAEHWMYLASFGVFLFLAVAIRRLFESAKALGRVAFTAAVFAAVFFYSGLTIGQNIYWRSGTDLSDRVLAFSSNDAAAMYFKAVSCLKKGMKERSLDIMRKYAGMNRHEPRAWYLKGRLALAAGETNEAERDFKRSIDLDPDYANGYLGSALTSFVKGRQDEGIRALERAVQLSPQYSEAYLLLVQAYARAGENEKAFNAAKAARKTDPYDYNALLNLGTAYTKKGDLRKGAQLYMEASRLYPENPAAYYNLGYVFYISGRKEEAKAWLRKAIMADPEYQPAIKLLRQIQ
jgi:tetratricopeptide (TPR) repeat protein